MSKALLLVGAILALAAPASAQTIRCPDLTLAQRIEGADAVFVGRLQSTSPVASDGGVEQALHRFAVDQVVKGDVPQNVVVRAVPLTDSTGRPLELDQPVGVLATGVDGVLVSSSCGLVDAGGLLSEADEPKGTPIKIVIGIVILGLVLAYAVRRLRTRGPIEIPGRRSPP